MVNKKEVFEKLGKIEKTEDKIKFLENILKRLKDKDFIKELQELLEELKEPELEFAKEEKFSVPQTKIEQKQENLEEFVRREEPEVKKEETKEKKYVSDLDYGVKSVKYKDTRVESPFFDKLKMRLGNAGLLPNDMIFTDKNIKDIKLYMGKMDIPQDRIEKYVERITDLKHSLYDPVKTKNTFEMEYEE